jgi:hypothetical protein
MSKIDRNIDKFIHDHPELCTDLREEFSEEIEAINGGYTERFTIKNEVSNLDVSYSVDSALGRLAPNYYEDWTSTSGGFVQFDRDSRSGYQSSPRYNLSNGRIYAFRSNTSTSNIYDIDLYDIT